MQKCWQWSLKLLLAVGVKEFQINVGNVDFFQSLMEDASLEEEERERVLELIGNRNYFGLQEYLESIGRHPECERSICVIGRVDRWCRDSCEAKNLAPNSSGIMAVKRLEKIYDMLALYGVENYVTFDLSMMGTYGYYTGIIFRGYTYGTGDAIVKGGRYDHLLEKFGKTSPSIGFAIVVDELMNAMNRQKLRIVYTRKNTADSV